MTPSNSLVHQNFLGTRYFSSLNGLRCLSILAVIWHHSSHLAYEVPYFLKRGFLGVELFFVISGFLITTLLLRERDAFGEVSLKNFYWRRTLRIFPLYYSVLFIYVCLVAFFKNDSPEGQAFWGHLPFYLSYTSNWFVSLTSQSVIFYFAWSLATEEQFYLVWPVLQKLLHRYWAPLLVVAAIVLDQTFTSSYPLLTTIIRSISSAICLGVLLAYLLHYKKTYDILSKILGNQYAVSVSLFILLSLILIPTELNASAVFIIQLAMMVFVGTCVIREDHALSRVFSGKVFYEIGLVSYGMYLFHLLCLHLVGFLLEKTFGAKPVIPLFIMGTILSYCVASFSFKYYESYFLRLKDLAKRPIKK